MWENSYFLLMVIFSIAAALTWRWSKVDGAGEIMPWLFGVVVVVILIWGTVSYFRISEWMDDDNELGL